MFYMEIAKRMEAYLLDAGVKRHKVRSTIAKVCGISPQSVHQWFDGRTKAPSAEHLALFAGKYSLNLMWLVTGKGPQLANYSSDPTIQQAIDLFRGLPPHLRTAGLQTLLALERAGQEESE